jgi:hypothetical protein
MYTGYFYQFCAFLSLNVITYLCTDDARVIHVEILKSNFRIARVLYEDNICGWRWDRKKIFDRSVS